MELPIITKHKESTKGGQQNAVDMNPAQNSTAILVHARPSLPKEVPVQQICRVKKKAVVGGHGEIHDLDRFAHIALVSKSWSTAAPVMILLIIAIWTRYREFLQPLALTQNFRIHYFTIQNRLGSWVFKIRCMKCGLDENFLIVNLLRNHWCITISRSSPSNWDPL